MTVNAPEQRRQSTTVGDPAVTVPRADPLRVVHISPGGSGGAHLAALRLHHGLREWGVDSRMLVGRDGDGQELVNLPTARPRATRALRWLSWRAGVADVLAPDPFTLASHPLLQSADVIHYHSLHSGFFNYLAIPRLSSGRTAVLTLHDMWSFTGHCAYSYDCERWRTGCGQCPILDDHPSVGRDGTHLEWRLKAAVYARSRLGVVAPSRWLADLARQSMLGRFPVHHIPYGLDITAYAPQDPVACRALLGLPAEGPVILCAAADLRARRKGADVLVAAWRMLPADLRRGATVAIMGEGGQALAHQLDSRVALLGVCQGDRLKAVAMNAADLLVMPSRADNLPLMIMEMMACGRPVVATAVGGIVDLVEDGVTGRLFPTEAAAALAEMLVELCTSSEQRTRLGVAARGRMVERHSLAAQAQQYLTVYQHRRSGAGGVAAAAHGAGR